MIHVTKREREFKRTTNLLSQDENIVLYLKYVYYCMNKDNPAIADWKTFVQA